MKQKLFLIIVFFLHLLPAHSQQVVHSDNTIILGNQCTGIDCTTSESFGFDIHRYKESNLRIHFDDATENNSSFPKNDWRITINDSNFGGDDYFSIDDATAGQQVFRIEAGAPLNALYVKTNGKLGLGTNTPEKMIHILSGASPGIRLQQDTSADSPPKTWDISANENSFDLTDVSNASSPFSIISNAPSESIVIDSTGNIGIGTASPSAGLHLSNRDLRVEGSISSVWNTSNPDTNLLSILNTNTSLNSDQVPAFTLLANGRMGIGIATPGFDLQVAGDVDVTGELTAASDERLKKDIEPIEGALKILSAMDPVSYQFRRDKFPSLNLSNKRKMGLLAQQVESVLPNLVVQKTEAIDRDGNTYNLKSINYIEIIPILIRGIQEQQILIDQQANTIKKLTAEQGDLKSLTSDIRSLQMEIQNLKKDLAIKNNIQERDKSR